jgi:anti-sigma B factor antagonist
LQLKKSQIKPGVTLVAFTDSIKMGEDCRKLEEEIDQLIRQNEKCVIFDLSDVTYLDSSGIGSIVKCLSRLKKSGGGLRLAGVKGMVEGVLKLTRVNTVIEIFTTASEASEGFTPTPQ